MADVRILFTANPLVGHVFPMLPLMHAARAAGHEVVLATGADLVPGMQRRGLPTWTVGPTSSDMFAGLAHLTRTGALRPGQTGALVSAGGGFAWTVAVLEILTAA